MFFNSFLVVLFEVSKILLQFILFIHAYKYFKHLICRNVIKINIINLGNVYLNVDCVNLCHLL